MHCDPLIRYSSVHQDDFRRTFKNISRIMDCVGCFKCRLWGKLQVRVPEMSPVPSTDSNGISTHVTCSMSDGQSRISRLDPGFRHGSEDPVLGEANWNTSSVRQRQTVLPAQPAGDRFPLQRFREVRTLSHFLHFKIFFYFWILSLLYQLNNRSFTLKAPHIEVLWTNII